MATKVEVHIGELAAGKYAIFRVAESFRGHRTLCIGILYVITIIGVLAFVARL